MKDLIGAPKIILEFFSFLVILIGEILWAGRISLVSLSLVLVSLLPSYLTWKYRGGKKRKEFLSFFKKTAFPIGLIVVLSSFVMRRIFSIGFEPVILSGILTPVFAIYFSLSDRCPNPPSLFTFSFREKGKTVLEKARKNPMNILILSSLILITIGGSLALKQDLMAGLTHEQKDIVNFQVLRLIIALDLLPIFSILLAFLTFKIIDAIGPILDTKLKSMMGDIPKEYRDIENKLKERENFYQKVLVSLGFIIGILYFLSLSPKLVAGNHIPFTAFILPWAIPLELSIILLSYKEMGELSSIDLPRHTIHQIFRREFGRRLVWFFLLAPVFIALLFLVPLFMEMYAKAVLVKIEWFSPKVVSILGNEASLVSEKVGATLLSLAKYIVELISHFLKYYLIVADISLTTFVVLYWNRVSDIHEGLKPIISGIIFMVVPFLSEELIIGKVIHIGESALVALFPTLMIAGGPKIVEWFEERMETKECPECGRRNPEEINSCIHCQFLLDKLSILEELGEEIKTEVIDLDDLITSIFKKKKESISEKGIELEYEKERYKIQAGPNLREVFLSILENAIIHADCQKIRISTDDFEDEIIVRIEDDGKGILPKDKRRIFEKGFKKGEAACDGIGTYLAKRVTEEYEGKIEVKDSELGGARFDIRLRKAE